MATRNGDWLDAYCNIGQHSGGSIGVHPNPAIGEKTLVITFGDVYLSFPYPVAAWIAHAVLGELEKAGFSESSIKTEEEAPLTTVGAG